MNKIVAIVFALICPLLLLCGCGNVEKQILFVAPDGAPSLSVAGLMQDDYQIGGETQYKVVSSADVGAYFATGQASAGVLPLNLATKMKDYQIVSINTFGNLYIVGKNGDGVSDLLGETLHVINLNNVPGLTLRLALQNCEINYTFNEIESGSENILLKGINAADLAGLFVAGKANFAVVAEPMCSKLLNMNSELKIVADVQELFGEYPQSVLVVKKGVFSDADVKRMLEKLKVGVPIEVAQNAISAHLEKGVVSAFAGVTLTNEIIARCNIGCRLASENKQFINDYITKIIALQPNSATLLTDDRFYV